MGRLQIDTAASAAPWPQPQYSWPQPCPGNGDGDGMGGIPAPSPSMAAVARRFDPPKTSYPPKPSDPPQTSWMSRVRRYSAMAVEHTFATSGPPKASSMVRGKSWMNAITFGFASMPWILSESDDS